MLWEPDIKGFFYGPVFAAFLLAVVPTAVDCHVRIPPNCDHRLQMTNHRGVIQVRHDRKKRGRLVLSHCHDPPRSNRTPVHLYGAPRARVWVFMDGYTANDIQMRLIAPEQFWENATGGQAMRKSDGTQFVLLGLIAALMGGCATMEDNYRSAQQQNSIAGYEGFVKAYPSGPYTDVAKRELEKLKEKKAFTDAQSKNTTAAYKEFLLKYGSAKDMYSEVANRRAAEADDEAFQKDMLHENTSSISRVCRELCGKQVCSDSHRLC